MKRDGQSSSGTTRRDVLKTSAATATAAGLFAALGSNFAHAAAPDVFKVGVIGAGGRGSGATQDHLDGAQLAGAKSEIYAVGDVFEGAAKTLGEKYNVDRGRIFGGLDAYKAVIDSGVDLVILATPPGFRPRHFKAAIDAGKHVFFEKPVAVDATGVRMVIEASEKAKEKNLAVVTGTQRRHETNYTETIKAIHDGAIGDVLHMSVYWNGGGIWSRPRKPEMSDAEYQINNWYHYIWLCGDQICEQHIHNLDVMNWVMNANPISAYGLGGRQVRKEPGQIWDHFGIEYEFPNGGRVLSMCRHWAQSDDNVSEFAIGTKGTSNPGGWIKPLGGQAKSFKNERSGYKQEHADLLKGIMDGKLPNEGRRVAESTLTAIMGRESCYSGRKIWWDKETAKKSGLTGRALDGAPTAMESKLDTFPKDLTLKSELPEPSVPMPDKYEPT